MIITAEEIDALASEKSVVQWYGYDEYRKDVRGEWQLDHYLIVNRELRQSWRVFVDARPMQHIIWPSASH